MILFYKQSSDPYAAFASTMLHDYDARFRSHFENPDMTYYFRFRFA